MALASLVLRRSPSPPPLRVRGCHRPLHQSMAVDSVREVWLSRVRDSNHRNAPVVHEEVPAKVRTKCPVVGVLEVAIFALAGWVTLARPTTGVRCKENGARSENAARAVSCCGPSSAGGQSPNFLEACVGTAAEEPE